MKRDTRTREQRWTSSDSTVFPQSGDIDVVQLRKMASVTLAQASNDGRLTNALSSSKNGEMDVEQLRKMASETLAQTSNDARLAKALSSSKSGEMDVEHLRKMASDTLAQASKMGGQRKHCLLRIAATETPSSSAKR